MSGLAGARLYLVAGARIGDVQLADLVPELAAAGVDLVQLREKEMEAAALLRAGEEIAAACGEAGIPFVMNDRPDIALALGCGVHLGQDDVPVDIARRIVPPGSIVGRSTHSREQIEEELARREHVHYIAVGPVYETPTKPGRPAAGVGLLDFAAHVVPAELPWFAIGGLNLETLPGAMEAGARRAVVVRAITEASDPPGAAAKIKALLEEVPL